MKSKTNKLIGPQIVVWLLTLLCLVPLCLLVYHFPWMVGLFFVSCLIVATVLHTRANGFWSGAWFFFKSVLFGG